MAILKMSIFSLCALLLAIMRYVHSCNVYEYGESQKDKDFIVSKHNEFRKRIANGQVPGQPRGINLKRFVWDDYLAGQAQNIANTCILEHKPVSDNRWSVGQNLYIQYISNFQKGADWNAAIEGWFNEHTKYHYSTNYVFDKNTGHYTQVVWADTTHVGCGYTYYPNPTGSQYAYSKLYVCNYGPTGNIIGGTIYIAGDHGCENLC